MTINSLKKILPRIKRFRSEFYRVPYCVPAWGWREHRQFFACLLTGKMVHGPDIDRLLAAMREKTGSRYVFGFNSGREAIWAALLAAGIGQGDRVIMPSYCCETVADAVLACGAEPLFCDIAADFSPDIDHVLKLADQNPRAIIFTHLFGNPGPIHILEEKLQQKNVRNKILLIDDAAQSFGAEINRRLIGTFGDAGIISFGPGKTMTATGGGILITNSAALAAKLEAISSETVPESIKRKKVLYWFIFRRWRKYTLGVWRFTKGLFVGSGHHGDVPAALCNVDAAIVLEQLNKLNTMLTIRRQRKSALDQILADNSGGMFEANRSTSEDHHCKDAVTKYPLIIAKENASDDIVNRYFNEMRRCGIELQPLYQPIHLKCWPETLITLERTEFIMHRIIQVPVEPSISNCDYTFAEQKFAEFVDRCAKNQK